jgi:hypothetical protein
MENVHSKGLSGCAPLNCLWITIVRHMAAFTYASIEKRQNQSGSSGWFSILVVLRGYYYTYFPPQKQ